MVFMVRVSPLVAEVVAMDDPAAEGAPKRNRILVALLMVVAALVGNPVVADRSAAIGTPSRDLTEEAGRVVPKPAGGVVSRAPQWFAAVGTDEMLGVPESPLGFDILAALNGSITGGTDPLLSS